MRVLLVLFLLAGMVRAEDTLSTYRSLLGIVAVKFNTFQENYKNTQRGDAYLWGFLSAKNFPYGCVAETLLVDTSRYVQVDSTVVYWQNDSPLRFRVCSFMKRNEKYRTVHLLFFQRNSECCWEEWREPLRVLEKRGSEAFVCDESPEL
jgi:hypothetical protein